MSETLLRLFILEVRVEHDVVLCRQRARELAGALGFDRQDQTRVATAVSEIVRNAFDYARGGTVEFAVATVRHQTTVGRRRAETQNLVVTVRDQGPGIPAAGEREPSGGLGIGLAGARRLMDALEIATRPGATAVTLRKAFPAASPLFSAPQLQAVADRLAGAPPPDALAELQLQNQELLRALDEVRARQEDIARVNQELTDTNAGVLALYDELETLHRVATLLAAQLDLQTLLQAVIDATTELTDAPFGAFFYRHGTTGRWSLHAAAGPARAVLDGLPAFGDEDFLDAALQGGARGQEKFARALDGAFALRSYLSIPVASAAGTLGALVFGSAEERAFTERSERIVASIAAQAVIGIEKAKLFEEVQNFSAAKDRFLAMLSHELRTPLNPVLAVVSSLAGDDRLPAEVRADLAVALRNVRLEARLIDDLLDFSRIINGKLQLHREPLDLHALIRGVVDICAEDIAGRSHVVTLALDAPRAVVLGDSARLQQVFWNVLKNAVKFTPAGGRITVGTRGTADHTVEVTVSDNGVGIEPAALTRIFSAFEQGEAGVRRFGGLGLGLAISKAFVELHGGEVRAASAGLGLGARITIVLPLLDQKAETVAPAPETPRTAAARQATGTLLLIDDHADTLNITARLLTRRGHRVVTADTCRAAVEAVRQTRVDLIVSDLGLPDGSGLDLLGELRRIRDVPAVALSDYGMEEDVQQSRAAGYDEHLTKPVDFPLLARVIDRLLAAAAPPE